jgi:hypothetical protein
MSYFNDFQASDFYDNYTGSNEYNQPSNQKSVISLGYSKILYKTDKAILMETNNTYQIKDNAREALSKIGIEMNESLLSIRGWIPQKAIHKTTKTSIEVYSWFKNNGAFACYNGEKLTDVLKTHQNRQ